LASLAVEIKGLRKAYASVEVLRGVSLEVQAGDFVAITGPSGCGKSTLLNLIGTLDKPSGGSLRVLGRSVAELGRDERAALRNESLGFIFQSFNLLARESAWHNVALPLLYAGVRVRERERRAREALDEVGIGGLALRAAGELSGGQQQRVAIARALVHRPQLLLADEPTGNLDTHAGREIMQLIGGLHRSGLTVMLVTHDPQYARVANRIEPMRDGEFQRHDVRNAMSYSAIARCNDSEDVNAAL
jgi:putative ABC transport system ATP-binding protein